MSVITVLRPTGFALQAAVRAIRENPRALALCFVTLIGVGLLSQGLTAVLPAFPAPALACGGGERPIYVTDGKALTACGPAAAPIGCTWIEYDYESRPCPLGIPHGSTIIEVSAHGEVFYRR